MYCIVDIETTGSAAANSGITEISIYLHDGEKVVDHFTSLINPELHIPRYITALTGITNAMVASAPKFDEIAEQLYHILQGKIFVAHNVNFDFSFIKHHLQKSGYELQVRKLCTVRMSRRSFPGLRSYSLGNLCRSLNIQIENRHRADGDAKATVLLFELILKNNGQLIIDEMLKKSSGEQWLPMQLNKKVIDHLPNRPGVYYFKDIKGKVMYVGKAVNIKKRVSSHFTYHDAAERRQDFLRLIHDISYTQCVNELHALVLESAEIKRLWPKYNFSQKEPIQKYGLYFFQDNKGYFRLAIDKKKKNLPSICNFNLLNDAILLLKKMIESYQLNPKLCFLDKNNFSEIEMNTLENPKLYNEKVKKAITALEQQLPTFAVMEKGNNPSEMLCILMEKGSFWGMGYVSKKLKISSTEQLKDILEPYTDNNFIRNSIFNYIETYPHKKIPLTTSFAPIW